MTYLLNMNILSTITADTKDRRDAALDYIRVIFNSTKKRYTQVQIKNAYIKYLGV